MSHFTVLVIGDDPEKQLAPFQENNMGDCPEEYLVFDDREDEMMAAYMTGSCEQILLSDGTQLSPYDDRFHVNMNNSWRTDYVYPDDSTKVMVPFKAVYETFEDYASSWEGYSERDPKTGRYGYWNNPNCKWDWYQLGGRWNGFFRLRIGRDGVAGPGSWANEYHSPDADHADQAMKGDIDFEGMRFDAKRAAEAEWDTLVSWYGEIPRIELEWDEFLKMDYLGSIEEKRAAYWNQPSLLFWKKRAAQLRDDAELQSKYSKSEISTILWAELSTYQCTKEEYIAKAGASAIQTFAFVKDGQWIERGNMGWWGMISNEEDMGEWQRRFSEMLDTLPDDTLLSVYDCHI